jgi:c-di-GMP-binding flagellar brake protein YcgR
MMQERRRYERVPFSADLSVLDLTSGARYQGHSVDLSQGGIGFYCPRFLPVGSRVRLFIWLTGGGRRRCVAVEAQVRWARAEETGAIMGAEFDCLLNLAHQPLLYECLEQ